MMATDYATSAPQRRRPWHLVALGVLVLVLHWSLLGGFAYTMPWLAESSAVDAPPVLLPSLSTRVIANQAEPDTPPPTAAPVVARTRPASAAPRHTDIGVAVNSDTASGASATPASDNPATTPPPDSPGEQADTAALSSEPAGLDKAADSAAEAPAPAALPTAPAKSTERPLRFAFPPPMQLNYDVSGLTDGQQNVVSATIAWRHDGAAYQASLNVTKFMLSLRQWNSKGALTVAGLAPARFGEKGFRRAEVASHFVREEGRVIFSANSAPAPLLPGAQDHMSVFMQLASMWAGEPNRFGAGDSLSFQSIGPRQAETWTFVVSAEDRISVPGGNMQAIKLTREPTGEYSTKAEIWLAPQLAYMPAHIRLSEPNGNVLDMVWTGSQPL